MNQQFYNIYNLLYAEYSYDFAIVNRYRNDLTKRFKDEGYPSFDFVEYNFISLIRNTIDSNKLTIQLRPDAKYFLLTNFHNLIVRPILESSFNSPPNNLIFIESLPDDIRSDIDTIINVSVDKSLGIQEPISGHEIMTVINNIWRELRTTKIEIWG